MAYWKYRKQLNDGLGLPRDTRISTEQAKQGLGYIDEILGKQSKGSNITNLKFLKKLLNYAIKYNNYGFDENLINILPKKYRP